MERGEQRQQQGEQHAHTWLLILASYRPRLAEEIASRRKPLPHAPPSLNSSSHIFGCIVPWCTRVRSAAAVSSLKKGGSTTEKFARTAALWTVYVCSSSPAGVRWWS